MTTEFDPTITLHLFDIKTTHKKPYPAISPLKPEHNQAGKTVLITGGAGGIGYAIARAFIQASAAHVIVTSRRVGFLENGVKRLQAEAKALGSNTKISGYASDAGDLEAANKLWTGFKEAGIFVDVLVLNATIAGHIGPLLNTDVNDLWKTYEINVRSLFDYTKRFNAQEGGSKKKYLVNISTSIVHNLRDENPGIRAYGVTKNAGTVLIQQIAEDSNPDQLQIVSMHPGAILSDGARGTGLDESSWDFDDGKYTRNNLFLELHTVSNASTENLPGQTAVWAATEDAKFLHGRYMAAWWDIDELKRQEFKEKLEAEWHFLRVGVVGLTQLGHQKMSGSKN
ncbi:hypothetical protein QBC35DRAFT_385497 [Podospora australis]|uniref:NAD(P)-binding protein n=1 Tax=Podospora australis TaxID=1536484 RepID=A0AAN6WTJ8_9PEZI|nr:hypothetical protein QBC35DRAFT_385497 [Podospora australis]